VVPRNTRSPLPSPLPPPLSPPHAPISPAARPHRPTAAIPLLIMPIALISPSLDVKNTDDRRPFAGLPSRGRPRAWRPSRRALDPSRSSGAGRANAVDVDGIAPTELLARRVAGAERRNFGFSLCHCPLVQCDCPFWQWDIE